MSEKRPKIWMFDFDGTIAMKGQFPAPGGPVRPVVEYIKAIQERGDQWILWTNREGDALDIALKWLDGHGLHPDTVNDNLPQMKEFFKGNPRKPFANVTVDDLNAGGLYLPPPDGGMDFGSAIRHLKLGFKAARSSWHDSYVWILPEATVKREWCRDTLLLEAMGTADEIKCDACIRRRNGDGSVTSGWLPTLDDLMAEDWMLVYGMADVTTVKPSEAPEAREPVAIAVPPKGDKSTPMSWNIALAVMHDGGRVRREGWPPDKYYCVLRRDGVKAEGCLVDQLTAEATDLSKGGELALCCVVNGIVVPNWLAPSSKADLEGWLRAD